MKKCVIIGLGAIIMWNVAIIQRDKQLFKAYDVCTQFTYHPDCPYKK